MKAARHHKISFALTSLLSLGALEKASLAQERTVRLGAEVVACNEAQLEALLERFELVQEPNGPVGGFSPNPLVFVSEGRGALRYRGSEVRNEAEPHGPLPFVAPGRSDCVDARERMMGFALIVQENQFLLNPERLPVDQVLLARIEPQTNATSIRCPQSLLDTHHLRLGLGSGSDLFSPLLAIDNIREIPKGGVSEGATPAASTASRALRQAGLLARCHESLTAWDFRTFVLLERMIRPYATFIADETVYYHDIEVALFRGEDPHTYRANVYKIGLDAEGRGVALGRLAVEMVIGWDEAGRWTTGSARLLPPCLEGQSTGCSTEMGPAFVTFYPPILPDHGLRGDPPNAISVSVGIPGRPSEVAVDWGNLLAESVWNRGE